MIMTDNWLCITQYIKVWMKSVSVASWKRLYLTSHLFRFFISDKPRTRWRTNMGQLWIIQLKQEQSDETQLKSES